MPMQERSWLRSGLLWRTFLLLAFLIAVSMAAWVASFRVVERAPRSEQIAAQVDSIVTITRAALLHSAPMLRRELLLDLATTQGIRIYPKELTDNMEALPDTELVRLVTANVRKRLDKRTEFAGEVNGEEGFWVSFYIDDDDYWLMLDSDLIEGASSIQWIGWAGVTLLLSLVGAVFISRLINQPLARLSTAARAIARGKSPPVLPESGPAEIRDANRSFNQMVQDLKQVESDRAVILAGISHDLRTPIARMLLEVEMGSLSDEAKRGMQSDLAQMESIIAQFLDYARPAEPGTHAKFDLSAVVKQTVQEAQRSTDSELHCAVLDDLFVIGNPVEIARAVSNLIENARRYGKSTSSRQAEIEVCARGDEGEVLIEVSDKGVGIPESKIPYLLRPFTRMDSARSQANGAGLGLAIVDRIVQRHRGKLDIKNREGGGLAVRIWLKSA
ncbi:MAG: HAMP domain-containing protein [Burkholderiaceae bacterium]|nr:HAMP domain-containing protein [Burkholderiaceae bacterium]